MKFRMYYEIFLIRIAAWILSELNVSRSPFVSRKDNNEMLLMADKIDSICKRAIDGYTTT